MLSNVEKEFVRAALAENHRIDGRSAREYRPINVRYEGSKGCCFVDLGETKVMSQISWELSVPKDSRPNEGILKVNVELSPLIGSFASIPSTQPTAAQIVELNRLLERCLRESHCLDLESLCIESGTSAMTIKVDLHVLNHSGNLVDALVLAGIGALKHFRRPDVTYCGLETVVHTNEERDPLPLNLLHVPICTTFALFSLTNDHTVILMDPTDLEEKCCDWKVIIAANKHREICLMQTLGSRALTTVEQILLCCNLAIERAVEATNLIDRSLRENEERCKVAKTYSGVCMLMEEDFNKMNVSSSTTTTGDQENVVTSEEHDTDDVDATDNANQTTTETNPDKNQPKQSTTSSRKNKKNKKTKTQKNNDRNVKETDHKITEKLPSNPPQTQSNPSKKKNIRKKASHTIINAPSVGTGGESAWDVPNT